MSEITSDTHGRIFKDGTEYFGYKNWQGYKMACLNGKKIKWHRYIAIKYIQNPLQLETVNHIDGDKENNAGAKVMEKLLWIQ